MPRRLFLKATLTSVMLSSLSSASSVLRAQGTPLRMAVHPYSSTLTLVGVHRPLAQFLEKALGRPVEFYTAASFDAYVAALTAGEYDIAISPPHFGVMAIKGGDYVPLAHYRSRLNPFLVVRRESALHEATDLAGKRIAMADKTAFIRLAIIKLLADHGLAADKNYEVVEMPTHGASIMATVQGAADAGLAMGTILRLQPADIQQRVRPILSELKFPNLFTLAHRRMGEAQTALLKRALQDFTQTPEGKMFFDKTGYGGYEEITPDELAVLAPYAHMVRSDARIGSGARP